MPRLSSAVIVCLSLATVARATPIEALVNTSQSTVTVKLCILSKCDQDTSPVSGWAKVKVNPTISPTSLTLDDFYFSLTQSIDLNISWGFLGAITATGQNITMFFPPGYPPLAPTTVTSGSFLYAGVPANQTGIISYTATGLPCTLLGQYSLPCNDVIDLADQGTNTGDMNGTLTVSAARLLKLTLNPNYTGPLDPNNPSLGTMNITGTVVCTATVPLRGDADLNGVVNGSDIQTFIAVLLAPQNYAWRERYAVDMNDDDIFDLADVELFVACLLGNGCGS